MDTPVTNAFTVDLEDWYQVTNLAHIAEFGSWRSFEDRLPQSAGRILELLDVSRVKATFFVLGWNAQRHPELVKAIADAGHEIATHGYAHRLIYDQTRQEFADDLRRSVDTIGAASGRRVAGHRAASFSITSRALWAVEELVEQGIVYDSSILPIKHGRYGIPGSPSTPYRVGGDGMQLVEFPVSTANILGRQVPFAGGAYFRFLPYRAVRLAFRWLNHQGIPVMFYIHPWELDPGQPRMPLGFRLRLRCYHNIERVEVRLRRLLSQFSFSPAQQVLNSYAQRELPTIETPAQPVGRG